MLQSFLSKIKDPRRKQGRRYELEHILLLSGYIFTFDALHCQEKTLKTAKESGNEAIVPVKGNQKTLFNDCQTIAAATTPAEVYQEPVTKTRNRIESRQVGPLLNRC